MKRINLKVLRRYSPSFLLTVLIFCLIFCLMPPENKYVFIEFLHKCGVSSLEGFAMDFVVLVSIYVIFIWFCASFLFIEVIFSEFRRAIFRRKKRTKTS